MSDETHSILITADNPRLADLKKSWITTVFSADNGIGPMESLHQAGDSIVAVATMTDDGTMVVTAGSCSVLNNDGKGRSMIQFIDPVGVGPMMYQVVPGVEPECTTVELNVGKLDEVWRRYPHTYVGPGGYDIKEAKLTNIRNQLNANSPIEKPIVEAPSGNPERFHFVDGRHRVAVFRERGLVTCPFVVPKYLADAFLRRFG